MYFNGFFVACALLGWLLRKLEFFFGSVGWKFKSIRASCLYGILGFIGF